MGAAKNARKARRKADRLTDRRAYIFDIETVNSLPAGGVGDYFLSSSLVTVWDPKEGRNVAVGQSVELTRDQISKLVSEGFHPKREAKEDERPIDGPKFLFDFPDWYSRLDPTLFKERSGRSFSDIYQQFPAVTNSKATAGIGAGTRPYSWEDVDFSELELRVASQHGIAPREVQKKMAYMKAYGAVAKDFDRMFFDTIRGRQVVTHRMAPRHQMDYLTGRKESMMILDDIYGDDRIKREIINDQDVPEVGSLPANRTRIVGFDPT